MHGEHLVVGLMAKEIRDRGGELCADHSRKHPPHQVEEEAGY